MYTGKLLGRYVKCCISLVGDQLFVFNSRIDRIPHTKIELKRISEVYKYKKDNTVMCVKIDGGLIHWFKCKSEEECLQWIEEILERKEKTRDILNELGIRQKIFKEDGTIDNAFLRDESNIADPDQLLLSLFKTTATTVTQLYKESLNQSTKSYKNGYKQCLLDLMHFASLQQHQRDNIQGNRIALTFDELMTFTEGALTRLLGPFFIGGVVTLVSMFVSFTLACDVPFLWNSGRFFDAIFITFLAFFFGYFIYRDATTSPDGYDPGQEVMGNCVAFLLIISINVVMACNTYSWTIITFGSLILTLAVWIGFIFYYSSYSSSLTYGIIPRLFGEPAFYLITPVYFVLALAPRYIKKYIQVTHFPTDVDIIHEVNKYRIHIPDLPENYEFDDETYREKKKRKEKKREERRKARDLYWKKQKENFQKMVNILTPQSKTGDGNVKTSFTSTNATNISMGTNGSKYQFSTTEDASVPVIKINHSDLLESNDDASSQHSTATKKTKLFPSNVRTPTFSSLNSANGTGATTGADTSAGTGNEDELENANQTPQQKYIYNILKNQAIMKVLNSHFPKLKVKDYIHTANKRRPSNAGIVYMNDEKIVSNTGFCYSQESGMKEIITPSGNENILPSYETMRGGERTEWDNTIPKYKNFRRTRSFNDTYSRSRPEKLETRRYRTYQNNIFSKSVENFEYHRRLQSNSFRSPSDAEGFISSLNTNKNSSRKSKGKSSEY